jgi:DNA-binding response OmpR family regulator
LPITFSVIDLKVLRSSSGEMHWICGSSVIVLERRRSQAQTSAALRADSEPISRSELKAFGADGAAQKPFDVPALIAQIRGHLGAGREPRADRDPL